jgi:predicted DNA-binding transcriptional regulator AlpA
MPAETPTSAAPVQPAALDHATTAAFCGISDSHLFALEKTGRFGPIPIRLGRSKRFLTVEVRAWLAAGAPSRDRWLSMKGTGR